MTVARSRAARALSYTSRDWLHAALLAVNVFGCGDSEDAGTTCDELQSTSLAERRIEFGQLEAGTFVSFTDADGLRVVQGFQGGMWTMPAVRFWNLSANGHVSTSLALADGTLLGTNEIDVRLRSLDGALLLDFVPVPVGAAPGSPPPEAADQQLATLTLTYRDECQNVASVTMERRLDVEGAGSAP